MHRDFFQLIERRIRHDVVGYPTPLQKILAIKNVTTSSLQTCCTRRLNNATTALTGIIDRTDEAFLLEQTFAAPTRLDVLIGLVTIKDMRLARAQCHDGILRCN